MSDEAALAYFQGRLAGLRVNRYSWWVHWRELADYILPRRYKWLITPNQQMRGSPLNAHILDSTGTLAARNLSSGMMSGISSPTRPWLRLKIKGIDSTQPGPVALWLADVESLLMRIFQSSNFYNSIAQVYFDLVVFGTAVMIIYEDFENVINCFNPCAGEYYLDVDGKLRPVVLYREFVYTTAQTVGEFGIENVSATVKGLYEGRDGSGKTKEIVIAHAIEPNTFPHHGVDKRFPWREVYWEWGGSGNQQGGTSARGFLRKKGYYEQPNIAFRWDLVSNDPYGRSPGMDALPDIKQLQLQSRRKAQGIDKGVNPPMVADVQLKNQPSSMIPGGYTYVSGFSQSGNPGIAPAYGNWRPDIPALTEDLKEVRERIRKVFFNDILQTMMSLRAQTSSNVTATEVDTTKAESLIMLGPVLTRLFHEGLTNVVERTFGIAARAGILPPAPEQLAGGENIEIEFVSMLAVAQQAAATAGIERLLQVAGNLAAIDPATMDNIDIDYTLEKMSFLLNNDPRLMRTPEQLIAIRQQRMQQAQQAQQAETAEKMAAGAKTLSETELGGGRNALQEMIGV